MSGKGRGKNGTGNGLHPERDPKLEPEEPRPNGNGAAPEGEVLPFKRPYLGDARHDARQAQRAKQRAAVAKRAKTQATDAGDLAGEEPDLAQRVCGLAARGLSEEEIRTRLELPARVDDVTELVLADAFRRGQLLGRARIKEAQFEAALQGRVTAQTHVLARLGEPQGEEGAETDESAVGHPLPPGEDA